MTKDDEYHRAADHCLQMALNAVDDAYRVSWLNLAQGWLQLIPVDRRSMAEWSFDAVARAKREHRKGGGSTH
jgi:hypothetical protein